MKNKKRFEEQVYACWIGKNIGGTLGGPLEGLMEILDIDGYTQEFVGAVENDDLDLQLVALHCVEQYGGLMDSARLAQEWLSHVHFQYDEYGHALSNLRKGLHTPLSGKYNNFFTDCMGSPIRSELWGILCAGMPDVAAWYAFQDATVDHAGGEGVYGEIFFAVFESLAFCNTNIIELIRISLSYLPKACAVARAVYLLLDCYARKMDWKETRQQILTAFGSENFTYAPVNIAFTLLGLLYGDGFTQCLRITANCGYDTDCTCATIASMMGILYGPEYIDEMWTKPLGENILVSTPVNGFDAPSTIRELTDRTLRAHKQIAALYENTLDKHIFNVDFDVEREIFQLPIGSFRCCDLFCEIRYENNHPAIAPNETKNITLKVTNKTTMPFELGTVASMECGFTVIGGGYAFLEPGSSKEWIFNVQSSTRKAAGYSGTFYLKQRCGGHIWMQYTIPFQLLPTWDWEIKADDMPSEIIHCTTSRLETELLNLADRKIKRLSAHTNLIVPETAELRLISVCRQPIRLLVDGVLAVESAQPTAEIPAYHRADPCKCANLTLTAGKHTIEIQVSNAYELENLYFYAVDPNFNYAEMTGIWTDLERTV